MARSYSRARPGERLVAPMPYGHWHTTTFLCGLREDGLVAPLVLDGAINGAVFLAYVEQMLCPALRPGDVVTCDNLGSHKVAGVREAVEARGASLLYLPPYSPDRNPIELAFSKLKRCCALPPPAPSAPTGTPSAGCSTASNPTNASTICATADMHTQADHGLVGAALAAFAVAGTAQAVGLQRHRPLRRKADHLAQQGRVETLLQKCAKGDLVVRHRGELQGSELRSAIQPYPGAPQSKCEMGLTTRNRLPIHKAMPPPGTRIRAPHPGGGYPGHYATERHGTRVVRTPRGVRAFSLD
jgi:transposase